MRRVSASRSVLSLSRFGEQRLDLGLRVDAGAVGAAAGLGLGLGPGAGRLLSRLAEHAVGLFLRLLDGGVGGALSQDQRAPQRLVGLGRFGRGRTAAGLVDLALEVGDPRLGGLGAPLRVAHPLAEVSDARGDPLDEVVDVARVVPTATCLTELDGVERLWSQIHAGESNESAAPPGGQPRSAVSGPLSRSRGGAGCRRGRRRSATGRGPSLPCAPAAAWRGPETARDR